MIQKNILRVNNIYGDKIMKLEKLPGIAVENNSAINKG